MSIAADSRATPSLSLEQRAEVLQEVVQRATSRGWRVVSQTQTQAQLVKGKPTNHILHLILSIITLGTWIIVWILLAIFGGEKHELLTVDEWGNVR